MYNTTRANRYILYARKSSDSEDRQVDSIDDQIDTMRRRAQEIGITISEVITEAKSAKEPGRKEFNRMLKLISSGKYDGIVCWALNRLSRNPTDAGALMQLLEDGKVVHFACYSKEYTQSSDIGEMYSEFGRANAFKNQHRADVQRGVRRKAREGWYPYGCIPTGYKHINKHLRPELGIKEHIIPDPDRFHIIKELWKKRLKGSTVKELFRVAQEKGLTTSKGVPIKENALYYMFQNEFYAGYFKYKEEDGSSVRIKGKHKAMVSLKQYQLIQERSNYNKSTRTTIGNPYPLKGMIQCGTCYRGIIRQIKEYTWCTRCKRRFSSRRNRACKCGVSISAMKNPKQVLHKYYHCSGSKYGCKERVLTENAIIEQLKELLSTLETDSKSYSTIIKAAQLAFDIERQEETEVLSALKKQLTETRNKAKGLGAYAYSVGMSKDDYEQAKNGLENKIHTLEKQTSGVEGTKEDFIQKIVDETQFTIGIKRRIQGIDLTENDSILKYFRRNLILSQKTLRIKANCLLKAFSEALQGLPKNQARKEPEKPICHMAEMAVSKRLEAVILIWCTHLSLSRTEEEKLLPENPDGTH